MTWEADTTVQGTSYTQALADRATRSPQFARSRNGAGLGDRKGGKREEDNGVRIHADHRSRTGSNDKDAGRHLVPALGVNGESPVTCQPMICRVA